MLILIGRIDLCAYLSYIGDIGKDDAELSNAYEAGRKARIAGKGAKNPYYDSVVRGIERASNPQAATDWNLGYRDQSDATAKQLPPLSAFRLKSNRSYR